jgi:hypothetical protein
MRVGFAIGSVAPTGLLLLLLGACQAPPRIDGSAPELCLSTLQNVSAAASRGADSSAYAKTLGSMMGQLALAGIARTLTGLGNVFDDDASAVEFPEPDSTLYQMALCEGLDGLSAHEIIERSDSLTNRVEAAFERRYAVIQIRTLEETREQCNAIRDSLAQLRVVSARLMQEAGFIGLEARIILTVENATHYSISRAYFHAVAISPGRAVPWLEEDFNHSIPGGLEPGERSTWRLQPNMLQGQWTSVRVPAGATFEVEVARLDGADGEPLWGGVDFTAGDQELLDSLTRRFPESS